MNLTVDIESASSEPAPEEEDLRKWIRAALSNRRGDTEISLRLVDVDEMSQLNEAYRGNSGATNVLSFPADLPAELQLPLLGDIVICAPIVHREALEQGKSANAHWAHMAIHGTLHLLGFDHLEDEEAEVMEALETAILAELHYPCPYGSGSPRREQSAR
jgi:probable rRNA maturation factor